MFCRRHLQYFEECSCNTRKRCENTEKAAAVMNFKNNDEVPPRSLRDKGTGGTKQAKRGLFGTIILRSCLVY